MARFNGRQFLSVNFRPPPLASQNSVSALAEDSNGNLWVGTGTGLVRIARPALDNFDSSLATPYHLGPNSNEGVNCLLASGNGELWVGTSGGLYRLAGGSFVSILRGAVGEMHDGANGRLLVVIKGRFVEWNGKQIVEHPDYRQKLGIKPEDGIDVIQDHQGLTWFCTVGGLSVQSANGFSAFYGFRKQQSAFNAHRAYADANGNIWIGFSDGLYRVSGTKPGRRELLVSTTARVIYSDRDGNFWVGTNGEGLMRFTDRAVSMFTKESGLPNNTVMAVLAKADGSLWVGNNCGGLSTYREGRFYTYTDKDGLSNSCVWSLAEDQAGNLWIGTWGGGIFRLQNEHFTQFSKPNGLAGNVVRAIAVARNGSLWIGTNVGISHFANGAFHNYTTADGLSSNTILDVREDRHGDIWAATSAGVDRKFGNRFQIVPSPEQIVDLHSAHFAESASGDLYVIGAPNGLNAMIGGRLVPGYSKLPFMGMLAHRQDFWFAAMNGIFRFAAKDLAPGAEEHETPLNFTSFGVTDGLNTEQASIGNPNMAITKDGLLWVATVKGLAQLDLNRLRVSRAKPSLWVSEVTVDRTTIPGGRELVLPPGKNRVELHFDSVSLASSEKVKFQYRMDDVDPVWLDADRSLTAVYTSLPIGKHSFHLRACNKDGIWDLVGISYPVTQQPFVYETRWFRLGSLAALLLLLTGAYQLRLKQLATQYNLRLIERVNERTRIARELHDTLLQSFHGLLLRFQAVDDLLPDRALQAKRSLGIAIDLAAEAVTESRDAVQELRASRIANNNLVDGLTSIGHEIRSEFAADDTRGSKLPKFRVTVEGKQRHVNFTLLDELYRITKEALRNAFTHAQAKQIEVDLRFNSKALRLLIRDDGIGMPPTVVAQGGREGHWGLTGIRERVRGAGGHLEIWSEPKRGTEIEVTIPAAVAYRRSPYSQGSSDL